MTTANQIGLGVVLAILVYAVPMLLVRAVSTVMGWFIHDPAAAPQFLGSQLATIHVHGIVTEDR